MVDGLGFLVKRETSHINSTLPTNIGSTIVASRQELRVQHKRELEKKEETTPTSTNAPSSKPVAGNSGTNKPPVKSLSATNAPTACPPALMAMTMSGPGFALTSLELGLSPFAFCADTT